MNYQLPANYDAWRLAPPEPAVTAVAEVSRYLSIEGGDLFIDGTATYCAETGDIVRFEFNGRAWEVSDLRAWLALGTSGNIGAWDRALTGSEIDALIREEMAQ